MVTPTTRRTRLLAVSIGAAAAGLLAIVIALVVILGPWRATRSAGSDSPPESQQQREPQGVEERHKALVEQYKADVERMEEEWEKVIEAGEAERRKIREIQSLTASPLPPVPHTRPSDRRPEPQRERPAE